MKKMFSGTIIRTISLLGMVAFGLIPQTWGVTYNYTTIQVPGAASTMPTAINNKGEIVGTYRTTSGLETVSSS